MHGNKGVKPELFIYIYTLYVDVFQLNIANPRDRSPGGPSFTLQSIRDGSTGVRGLPVTFASVTYKTKSFKMLHNEHVRLY